MNWYNFSLENGSSLFLIFIYELGGKMSIFTFSNNLSFLVAVGEKI